MLREDVTPASQYSGMLTLHDKAAVTDAPWWSDQDDNTSVNTCHAREGAKVSWANLVRSSKSKKRELTTSTTNAITIVSIRRVGTIAEESRGARIQGGT